MSRAPGQDYLNSARDHPSRHAPVHRDPLLSTLERIGCGGVMRNRLGRVTDINFSALHLLEREVGAMDLDSLHRVSRAAERLLNRVSARVPADGASWVTVRRDSGRPLAVYQLEIGDPPGSTILILVDLDNSLQPRRCTLRRMFGLTTAEMNLASGIALGCAPTD